MSSLAAKQAERTEPNNGRRHYHCFFGARIAADGTVGPRHVLRLTARFLVVRIRTPQAGTHWLRHIHGNGTMTTKTAVVQKVQYNNASSGEFKGGGGTPPPLLALEMFSASHRFRYKTPIAHYLHLR